MLGITIDATSLQKAKKSLDKKGKNVAGVIQTILSKSVLIVERYGKLYSPVRTGRMRASITPISITEMSAAVGPQVEYAKYVHRRIPFMFAARQDAEPEVQKVARDEIKKALN